MSEQIKLRQETKNDFSEIYEVNQLAFGQENEAKLVDALRNNSAAFVPQLSIVATENDKIVGHILFTKINHYQTGKIEIKQKQLKWAA